MTGAALTIRRATPEDTPALLALLRVSMQRAADDRFDALYRWKHVENAFGPSPAWVACDGADVVALRVFLRWEFVRDDRTVRAVRAVDTATHPEYQGRGLFTKLTLGALPELEAEGVELVFNTPNTQSRPGYLKMGWHDVGRLPAWARPLRPLGMTAMLRARAAASHWSEAVRFGDDVASVIADPRLDDLVRALPTAAGLRTRVDRAFLAWRYGTPLLAYRAVTGAGGIDGGVAFVRVRQRGAARELVVAHVLAPAGAPRARAALLRAVRRAARGAADYAIAIGRTPGFVPVPGQGPLLTARAVRADADVPRAIADVELSLGDVELF